MQGVTRTFHDFSIFSMRYAQDLPRWLAVGLHLLALKRSGDTAAWQRELGQQEDSPQTLNKFVRLAGFLLQHYPDTLVPGAGFSAGSAVMLEFIKLHELSEDLAREHAQEVFSGHASVRTVRALFRRARAQLGPNTPAAQDKSTRYADFSQRVIQLLLHQPETLNLGPIKLKLTQTRSTLAPKLVALTPEGEVAVDVRALDVTAARTLATGASLLASRIAVLRLRYDRVIVVMPEKSAAYVGKTVDVLSDWAREPEALLSSVKFVLFDDANETFRWAS